MKGRFHNAGFELPAEERLFWAGWKAFRRRRGVAGWNPAEGGGTRRSAAQGGGFPPHCRICGAAIDELGKIRFNS